MSANTTRIVTPTDYTAFDTEELAELIKLAEDNVLTKQMEVDDLQTPYDEIHAKHEILHKQLMEAGAALSAKKSEHAKAELTLVKLRDMFQGKRGGLMYKKLPQTTTASEAAVAGERKKREFKWSDAAEKVLREKGTVLNIYDLFERVAEVPEIAAKMQHVDKEQRKELRRNFAKAITNAARRTETVDRKLGYHIGRIGLAEWFDEHGEPLPKYVLFTGPNFASSKSTDE